MSQAVKITILATVGVMLVIVLQMVALDTNASLYLSVGEEAPVNRAYIQDRLGETYEKPELGHDGRFFFVQAQDPFILDPDVYDEVIDRPLYRSQRLLYPLLASPARVVSQWTMVWWMLGINVIAMAAGTYFTARVAERMGLSAWLGLAFTLNPGVWAELNAGSAGTLAWALAVGGILMYLEGRLPLAVGLLVGAVLAREAMLLVVAGVALHSWRTHERIPPALAAPVLTAIAWGLYVRVRMGADLWASESEEFGLPLAGFIGAVGDWLDDADAVRMLVGLVFVVLLFRFVALARRVPHVVGWAVLGFAAMAPFFSSQVWFNPYDISRAVLPVVTAFVLLAALDIQQSASVKGVPPEASG
ncbi:MAG: hypothetical protein OER12_02975 [Acidimicrobiia bacterium]|nr:hypothetical protein [Acidimicrobiia bacterium]